MFGLYSIDPMFFLPTPLSLIPNPVSYLFDELTFDNMFVRPNLLMWNRPEVFVFNTGKMVFVVESGSGGIRGHAHGLSRVKNPKKVCKGALVYFTVDSEYLHSHPDVAHEYYIAKNGAEYAIWDSETESIVNRTSFDAGHYHSLKIRDVIPVISIVENEKK